MFIEKENIYQKKFTEIPGIQFSRSIAYSITKKKIQDKKVYGIEILEIYNGKKNLCKMESLSTSKNDVKDLLTFLYENAVEAKSCEVIVYDLIESTKKFSYKII